MNIIFEKEKYIINTQKEYIGELQNIFNIFSEAGLPTENLEELIQFIGRQELLIPVVGEFSAGKSTLLNSFMGGEKNLLPTSVTPETAIATELRFGTDERIEAIDRNGNVIKVYGITDFKKINQLSKDYSYLKLYINNENIRSIEPLVLVDMPGFESPLDAHNDAIKKYLYRGSHFILLVSATDGTLKATSIRHLNSILEFERDFSVIVSKSNLVEASNLESIIEKVKEDIDLNFGLLKNPLAVGIDCEIAIENIVSDLNPENLFKSIVLPKIKDTLYQLESTANMKIAAFNRDTNANDAIVESLKNSLAKITRESMSLKNNARSNLVENNVQAIVNGVGRDLSNSADSLVDIGMRYGSDSLYSEIQDITHNSLVSNIKTAVRNISDNITLKYSVELEHLNSDMNAYCGENNFIQRLTENARNLYDSRAEDEARQNGEDSREIISGVVYKTLTTVLAVTTSILNPIVELLIIFLPEIVGNFFGKKIEEMQLAEQKENLRSNFLIQVIPDIKRKIASEVPSILEKNVNQMIDEISKRYSQIIDEKKNEVLKAEEERNKKASEIAEIKKKLAAAKNCAEDFTKKLFA